MQTLDSLIACPRCSAPLVNLACQACVTTYPSIGGVPFLFPEPEYAIADWRNRWRLERQNLNRNAGRAKQAAATAVGPARVRLQRLANGYEQQLKAVEVIIAPMLGEDRGAARETLLALQTRLPSHHAPSSYATNIVRDWAWGDAETTSALALLEPLLPPGEPVLQLGSGAGRLAFELGKSRAVVALDSNPLLVLLAHQLCSGQSRSFVEFPLAPIRSEDVCIRHALRAEGGSGHVRHLVADAMHPPIQRKVCPVILTHWLIDVLDQPFPVVASLINSLLQPDGVWVNLGSLAFDHAQPAQNLLRDEVESALETAGFAIETLREDELPYLQSPHSRQHRHELMVSWRARKIRESNRPDTIRRLPEWLAGSQTAIPLLPAFVTQTATVRIHAWIMSTIDGKRSLADIAVELERQGLMPRVEAEVAIRGFLMIMHDEMLRSG